MGVIVVVAFHEGYHDVFIKEPTLFTPLALSQAVMLLYALYYLVTGNLHLTWIMVPLAYLSVLLMMTTFMVLVWWIYTPEAEGLEALLKMLVALSVVVPCGMISGGLLLIVNQTRADVLSLKSLNLNEFESKGRICEDGGRCYPLACGKCSTNKVSREQAKRYPRTQERHPSQALQGQKGIWVDPNGAWSCVRIWVVAVRSWAYLILGNLL
jgi:hypothetical protein